MTDVLACNEDKAHRADGGMEGSAFEERLEPYRRELHVHCYRMLGSFDAADDLVGETFARAWRRRERLDREAWFRAWLYRLATNACLEALGSSSRRTPPLSSTAEVSWLQPYPDRLLDEVGSDDCGAVVRKDTIELAYVGALQLLPPRQRAALILRDVLGWSLRETAGLLDTSIAAANSALQRARVAVQPHVPARRNGCLAAAPNSDEQSVLERFIDVHEQADAAAVAALFPDGTRIAMPPQSFTYEWRLVPTAANRQPAAASYVRAPGTVEYRAFKLDVLRIEDGAIAEVSTFGTRLFPAFGLPATNSGGNQPR
ncbi:MAG TPA: RNA polymerase subunit sigma-70 [Ilumatobacteraceae bacterium]|nr:RNA polymerase subunit sigma-70 [Ilumatobacteraceae bacterium]